MATFHRIRNDEDRRNPFDTCPSVSIAFFSDFISYLRQNFQVVSLRALCRERHTNSRLAAITFDDGWRDNYDLAYPILKDLRVPATVFLTTGRIGSSKPFWQQVVGKGFGLYSHDEACAGALAFRRILGIPSDFPLSGAAYFHVVRKLKTLQSSELAALGESLETLDERRTERLFLCESEIKEMVANGIEFGSHTVNHTILINEEEDVVRSELTESKRDLESLIGDNVDMVAYPNGDFSDSVASIARSCGYMIGCTTVRGSVKANSNAMRLPRVEADWMIKGGKGASFNERMFLWSLR